MKKAPTSCWQDIGAKETDDRLFGAVPFLNCRKLKKGASLLAVEYQQIGARNFGYLFWGNMVPFLREMADSKRAQADLSANRVETRVQIQPVRPKPCFASMV